MGDELRPANGLIEVEQLIVDHIIDGLAVGVAIDVGCGTGRHARYLADRGHSVIGVDTSPEMLKRAQGKAPLACFIEADSWALPIADDCARRPGGLLPDPDPSA